MLRERHVGYNYEEKEYRIDIEVAKRIFIQMVKYQQYMKQGPSAYRINAENVVSYLLYTKVLKDNYSTSYDIANAYIDYLSSELSLFSKQYIRARRSPGRGGAHVNYYRYLTVKGERQAISLGLFIGRGILV